MSGIWVFGYGSLVNPATHDHARHHAARLTGWRRSWRHFIDRPDRRVVSLTVSEAPGETIEGRIVFVPADAQAALDTREQGYERIALPPGTLEIDGPEREVVMYRSLSERGGSPSHPILQSYLDVVLEGFAGLGGADSVAAFLATTDGWEAPVLRDRSAPIYPRALPLDPARAAAHDALLAAHGVRWIDAQDAGTVAGTSA